MDDHRKIHRQRATNTDKQKQENLNGHTDSQKVPKLQGDI